MLMGHINVINNLTRNVNSAARVLGLFCSLIGSTFTPTCLTYRFSQQRSFARYIVQINSHVWDTVIPNATNHSNLSQVTAV